MIINMLLASDCSAQNTFLKKFLKYASDHSSGIFTTVLSSFFHSYSDAYVFPF